MRLRNRMSCPALMLLCALGAAAPACAADKQVISVGATVVKPLVLEHIQDLDLGAIAIQPGFWSTATVGISRTGAFSCTSPNTICSGAVQVARYRVSGTNNRTVRISVPNVTMVNTSDPTKSLTLVPDHPASVLLTSSGWPGVVFPIGGTITLRSTTPDGLYSGQFNVTVDYQ